ncbi:two-component system response regulator [Magnetococcales bacterium HHB-1]
MLLKSACFKTALSLSSPLLKQHALTWHLYTMRHHDTMGGSHIQHTNTMNQDNPSMSNEDDLLTSADDDALIFSEEENSNDHAPESLPENAKKSWKIMVIDDDLEVHALTKLVLKDVTFKGRPLQLISGYSGKEARQLIETHFDTALILLDVVMEEIDAGLHVVRHIREVLKNPFVRIILRTGQPGDVPEQDVIVQYHINDYKEKTELTDQKLITAVITGLRTYDDLRTIEDLVYAHDKMAVKKRQAEDQFAIASQVFNSALEEVSDQLRITSKVVEHAQEEVMILNQEGVIIQINPAFTEKTGYTENEMHGRLPIILNPEWYGQKFPEILKEHHLNSTWQDEVWHRRKNGETYPVQLILTPITDRNHNITHYVTVATDLSEIKRSEAELHHRRNHDALTGLANRELFFDRLEQALCLARRYNQELAVLVFDLDHFKNVNDALGFSAGDQVLHQAAKRLERIIRGGDTACRLGGDEFAFIIREIDSIKNVTRVLAKLRRRLERHFTVQEHKVVVTASIGIALYPNDADDATTLLKNAHVAVSRAKKAGRNCFQFYTDAMSTEASQRFRLEASLRQALDKDQFTLLYQPKIDRCSGRITSMEVLIRWIHPKEGMISPADFIPLAEETGLILPIGTWVLNEACQQTKQWINQGLGPLRVAVNLSPRQFQDEKLIETITNILEETDLSPESLELEITESMVIHHAEDAISTMKKLRHLGLHISMDDFGTGYSSLNYLKRFPIHTLKIDRSFVQDITTHEEDATIVTTIISMAKALKLSVVAEGVETEAQNAFLTEKKCDALQGYLFGKPEPAEQFYQRLRQQQDNL